jgi:hypothetical protein
VWRRRLEECSCVGLYKDMGKMRYVYYVLMAGVNGIHTGSYSGKAQDVYNM